MRLRIAGNADAECLMDLINELAEQIPAIERLADEMLRTAVLQT